MINSSRSGQVISVDMLDSPMPGLITQITEILNTKRCKHAAVYVDVFSGVSYTYLQTTTSAEAILLEKAAFEQYAHQHGVKDHDYHAYNGILSCNK